MTIREYITSKFQSFGIKLSEADLVDISMTVNLDDDASGDKINDALKAMAIHVIPNLLLRAKSISENGFSISWDSDALLKYYAWLCKHLGIDDTLNQSSVTDISNMW